MSRNPDPGRSPGAPMAGNPGGVRIRARDIATRHPHPTAMAPVPVARRPHHRASGRRRDRFLLEWRRGGSRPAIFRTGVSRRLWPTGIRRRLHLTRVRRRLRRTRIGWCGILLGGGPRWRCQPDRQARYDKRCRCGSDFHQINVLSPPLSNAGSCRVVSCRQTGSAMACSRLCAPFHSDDGRTWPSLPI